MMTYQPIPEWLQPVKNEWMTQARISKFVAFERPDGYVLKGSTVVQKIAPPSRLYSVDPTGEMFSRRYLLKEVVARALAHGLRPVQVERGPGEEVVGSHIVRKDVAEFVRLELNKRDMEHSKRVRELRGAHLEELDRIRATAVEVAKLLLRAEEISGAPGVYVFVSGNEIVYVGQSKNVAKRVNGRSSLVDYARMIRITDPRRRDHVERFLIESFRPKGNKQMNPGYVTP